MVSSQEHEALSQDAWVRACEECLRASNFATLAVLLEQQPGTECAADAIFYRARIAVGNADFEEAARLFWNASREAITYDRKVLQQRNIVWEAYAESQLGNYVRAQELVDFLEDAVSADDPIYGDIFFVRGLIASEQDTLPAAQLWFERAYNVAKRFRDLWMEARCCANLAVIYDNQGLLDYSASVIRRVESINSSPGYTPNSQQLIQVRNIHIHNLRLQGELERALRLAEPLPKPKDDGTRLFAGYLTLTTAVVATDRGDFARAEKLWERAYEILREVKDDQRTQAELLWERAWLRLRQGEIEKANQAIREALFLINDKMETECYHGYVVAAIIAIRRNDLGTIGLILRQASERFRKVGHRVGLASVLLHIAAYYLQHGRTYPGREALAEALTLMWTHKLYSSYYWDPSTMVYLCQEAMKGEIWGDQATTLAARVLSISEAEVSKKFELEGGSEGMWGEFATSLAVRRLADDYWQEFVPLLSNSQPQVRRRAAQVLHAAHNPQAHALLERLREDTDPEVQRYVTAQFSSPAPIQIYSFGQLKLLLNGQPLKLYGASTRKALVIFGALLIVGEHGMNSSDLALLLWPEKPKDARSRALQTTISNLRTELHKVLGDKRDDVIKWIDGRYYLNLEVKDFWWDWSKLHRIALQKQIDTRIQQEAEQLYQESFMDIFSDLMPPAKLDRPTENYWERVVRSLSDMAADYETQAAMWISEIREKTVNPDTETAHGK